MSRVRLRLVGVACAGVVAVVLGGGVRAGAQAPPVVVDGNQTCADLAPPGMTWQELKVDPVASGNYSDGTLSVTVTVVDTPSGPTVDWTSNIGVDAVFVKGGTDGALYLYAPESTSGTGLHAPVNPANGQYFGLSHISFCYDTDITTATTTTTALASTTTTMVNSPPTVGATTTTTAVAATPPGSTTTSTPPGASTTTVAGAALASAAGPMLPRTGQNTLVVAAAGVVLLGIGLAARTAARRA